MKLAPEVRTTNTNTLNTARDILVNPMPSLMLQLGILASQVRKLSHLVENTFTVSGKIGVGATRHQVSFHKRCKKKRRERESV